MATCQVIRKPPINPPIEKIVLELSPEEFIIIKQLMGKTTEGGVLHKFLSPLYESLPDCHSFNELYSSRIELGNVTQKTVDSVIQSIKS